MDFYTSYMASEKWREKRSLILKRDGDHCQTCLSSEDLEVHHKTYANLGDEPPEDLITLCHECHEAITTVIRRRRYEGRAITISDHQSVTPIINIKVNNHGLPEVAISDHQRCADPPTQRADVRSYERLLKTNEEDQCQTRQDGRRF